MNYTYIVQCADGTLYTGWTNCLEKRLKAHNSGKNGAKYTKTKRPVTLVYYEGYATKEEAMTRRRRQSIIVEAVLPVYRSLMSARSFPLKHKV